MIAILATRRLSASVAASIAALAFAAPAHSVPFTLDRTFDDPISAGGNGFGFSVALDGSNVLVGASADDSNGTDVGIAYLFDAATGSLLQTFNDPTPTDKDQFGFAVAIDGSNVLIGARHDASNGFRIGQAHLFDASTGSLLHTFDDPTPTDRDSFGGAVAIQGNNVLIGALNDDTRGFRVGQAHLFDATTGALVRTFDDPTVTNQDLFGVSVAIDGNNVLIGAGDDDTNGLNVGQAYLFDATTGSLLRTFNDPTVTGGDIFGLRVALEGNNVLIGAPGDDTNGSNVGQAFLFDAQTGILRHTFNDPTVTVGDRFGVSVALDGNDVLIGAYRDDTNGTDVGQAYLFDAVTGDLLQVFDDPTVTGPDLFGEVLALDDNKVLIGGRGEAHLFVQTVPEPSSLPLFCVGVAAFRMLRWRKAAN